MVTTTNLVSYYKLDENAANTTVADSHGSNTGTATSNTSTLSASGRINTSLDFAGTDYVDTGNWNLSSGNITLSLWAYFNTFAQGSLIRHGFDGSNLPFSIFCNGTQIEAGFFDGVWRRVDYDISGNLSTATWYHLVFTYDGSTIRLWVDGVNVVSSSYIGSIPTSTRDVLIGGYDNQGTKSFQIDARIDEVAIFDAFEGTSGVSDLYNSGNGLAYPFTTGWTGIINDVTNPASINGIAIANIANVNGVS